MCVTITALMYTKAIIWGVERLIYLIYALWWSEIRVPTTEDIYCVLNKNQFTVKMNDSAINYSSLIKKKLKVIKPIFIDDRTEV